MTDVRAVAKSEPGPGSLMLPVLVACLAIALFSAMDAVMKSLSMQIGAYNALLWRTIFGAAVMTVWSMATVRAWPPRTIWPLHIARAAASAVMAFTFFWGIARVPLAEGIALSFVSPIIALFMAAVFLKERVGRHAVTASLLGFGGVIVIASARIGGDYAPDALWGVGSIMVSAVFYAVNLVLMRLQAQRAGPVEISTAQHLFVGMFLGLFAPAFGAWPAIEHMPAIAVSSLLTIASLMLFAWAYARAQAQHLLPVEYTAFIWAALLGYVVFAESVTTITLGGTALIVAGCIIAARAKPT